MNKKIFLGLALMLLLSVTLFGEDVTIPGDTGEVISFSGELFRAGSTVNAQVSFRFAFFNTETGGTALWSEDQMVDVADSKFTVLLGSVRPINLSFDEQYWIGMTINGEVAAGRKMLDHVPYTKLINVVKNSVVSPGTIAPFGGNLARIPEGWLLCDGRSYLQEEYPDLFNIIKTNFGAGESAEEFNVPDFRGVFLRGVDGEAGRDIDAPSRTALNTGGNTGNAVGSYQVDAFEKHTHGYYDNWSTSDRDGDCNGSCHFDRNNEDHYRTTSDPVSGRTASETRPKNVYVNYIIKY
ncbi:MAG: tail fiber protein [Spirochaetales bacterium]|nr:tail fiber protein [Spirochaetales bacterium]